jgi:uncharacterized SAM-binding protein YcdF (DUF218 family)
MLIERQSENTGENLLFTKNLLKEKAIKAQKILLVQKPYMERRAYATFKKVWPEAQCVVTSPDISFENYPNAVISENELINIMVGDLQRLKEYPAMRFQIEQEIPSDVWEAYELLVAAGYTQHLIPTS